jgi:hypothetical protein
MYKVVVVVEIFPLAGFIPYFLFVDCYWSGDTLPHIGQAMQTPLRQFPFIEDYLQDPGSTEKFIHFIISFCKLN